MSMVNPIVLDTEMRSSESVKITIDFEVYPQIGVEAAPSFWTRFKKSFVTLLANAICGVTNHSYDDVFGGIRKVENPTLPPV